MNLFQKIFLARQSPFIIASAALVVWLLCLPLFEDGMFIDGIQYAAVARNMARGVGTFWNPVLAQNSVAGLNTFHEHPPLVFFIQSLFFNVFGLYNIYPERIYCLFTFLITGAFMALIWRKIFEGATTVSLWWLPIALWIIMPVVFWSFTNDIQENTMGVFTTAALYFFLRSVTTGAVLRSPSFYLGCICVLLAGFSKGVPGLFPITFFFIYWLSFKRISLGSMIVYSISVLLLLSVAVFIILQNPVAKETLHLWFFERMLRRISSDPVENSHFHILIGLFTEQLIALGAVIIMLITFRARQVKNEISRGHVILFLALGLSGSLPLMLTLVQRDFYFTPALPAFAIAWALLIADGLIIMVEQLNQVPRWRNMVTAIASIALITGIAASAVEAGKTKRDKEILHDVYTLQRLVPENAFVSVTPNIMWWDWSFRCYMMRYNSISFSDKDTCAYFIVRNSTRVSDKFYPIDIPLHQYRIYRKQQ